MRKELEGLPEPAWFHHGELVLRLLDIYKPKVCVELGTYLGGSAIAIAKTIRQWGGRLTCVDVWDNDTRLQQCADNFVAHRVAPDIAMIRANSHDVPNWTQMLDFVYVDADHSYEGVRADLEYWWPFLVTGGVICGDDYGREENQVKEAWDEFETPRRVCYYDVTPGVPGHLVWAVKP